MAETVFMPKLGFDMAEGTLVRWVKKQGEQVNKGDVLAEIETDKATVEVESNFTGEVLRFLVEEGSSVPVSQPIAYIGEHGEKVAETETAMKEVADTPAEGDKLDSTKPQAAKKEEIEPLLEKPAGGIKPVTESMLRASPLAKRIAMEKLIDLSTIKGSGPEGRIIRRDVEGASLRAGTAGSVKPGPVGFATMSREDLIIPVDKLRAIIARRMQESKQEIPHFYVTHTYRVDELLRIRKAANEVMLESERLSVNDFIIKVAAFTLRKFPNLNASLRGKEIIRHGHINIGVAVALENGLMTVVCRDADQKPIRQISKEVKEMAERARQGKVKPEDIEGSTFSISNMGMHDVEDFAAIINSPEAAILAVSSAMDAPVVRNGTVEVGKQMKITISADHRISDGVEAAKFMKEMAIYLETPTNLLIEL
ncbi:MAG: dihydrolipoamide acetyltransferase family protein [Anaerolineaceae bacterium]